MTLEVSIVFLCSVYNCCTCSLLLVKPRGRISPVIYVSLLPSLYYVQYTHDVSLFFHLFLVMWLKNYYVKLQARRYTQKLQCP